MIRGMTDAAPEKSSRESPFWRFSVRFYARPEVAPACLELQDKAGVDVNLMLFLLFLAEEKRVLTNDEVVRLDARIASWRAQVVMPLRDLRRRLKGGIGEAARDLSEGLRNMVKRVELEAERLEQGLLEAQAAEVGTTGTSREAAAQANLATYSAFLGGLPEAPLQIVLAAFTTSPR
jgi:uncharacterized protein (TIGR02444 family)